MDSLKVSDDAAAAVAVAPRVTLQNIEAAISAEHYFTAGEAIKALGQPSSPQAPDPMDILTVCIMRMTNGFVVIGHSAPASPENFNAELGRKFARENAVRQLWPLMGFALREKLHGAMSVPPQSL